MRMWARLLFAVPALVVSASATAQAQASRPSPYELGVDGSILYRSTDVTVSDALPNASSTESRTTIALPVNAIRVGLFVTPRFEIEPSLSYERISVSDATYSQLDLSIAAPIYFTADRTKPQYFVRPVAGLFSVTGANSTQFDAGAGLGVKLPIDPRLAARLEAEYRHGFESGTLGAFNQIGLIVGFSVYTL